MALDGIFLHKLCEEISNELTDMHIDKIYQPSKEELVFIMRKKGVTRKLLISTKSTCSRLCFIDNQPENPATPPMFCMLLRKHLTGAAFCSIEQPGFERVAVLKFETKNEMHDRVTVSLIIELMGRNSNIILTDNTGRIIDCVKRSSIETSERIIQPGAKYTYPERPDKQNISLLSAKESLNLILSFVGGLQKAIIALYEGLSPLVAREICTRAGIDFEADCQSLSQADKSALEASLKQFIDEVNTKKTACVVYENENPIEFSFVDITQYSGFASKTYNSFSNTIEQFYSVRADRERIHSAAAGLQKLVQNLQSRINRKLNARMQDLKKSEKREKYRVYGELIKANLHLIERGATSVTVNNYYDPDFSEITIPLNSALSPADNAQKYFKDYKKGCVAAQLLTSLIDEGKEELQYIESVADELERAESIADLEAIRDELVRSGYAKQASKSKKPVKSPPPREFISPDGFKILVGRNNRQNDELTTKTAQKSDIWLHTKNIPGSHVIILCDGAQPPDSTIIFAAQKAAFYSKAKNPSQVPVDYTLVKHVKKPAGAKAGMVIFTHNKTLFVEPKE